MKKLDEQLQCSLHGDFNQGFKIAKELKEVVDSTRVDTILATREAYVKFKQKEEYQLNCIRADFNRGWYEMMNGDLFRGFYVYEHRQKRRSLGEQHLWSVRLRRYSRSFKPGPGWKFNQLE